MMDVHNQPTVAAAAVASISIAPGQPWRLRYWSIFVGQALSLIGSAMTQFVLMWWIADTTGSVAALASAGIAALLPQALLGPLGGIWADRYSRRVLMIVADLISALCMVVLIALFLTGSIELWHAYALMFVRSAMQAFQQPAAAASTAMLVPAHFLTRAAGLNQTLAGIMTVAAAPLGALAISLMPMGYALSIDVVTAVLGIVPLLIYAIPQHRVDKQDRAGLWTEFREGVATVSNDRGLLWLYVMCGAVVLVILPTFALVPLLVKEHFNGGAPEVALIESVSGIGMIAGGALIAALAPTKRVPWLIWGFSASCFTVALAAIAPSDMFWLAIIAWGLSGLTYIAGNAPFMALIQTRVPNQLQGRVLSLLTTIVGLAGPVGLALTTPLGEMIGVRWLFFAIGIAGGIVPLLAYLSPAVRHMDDDAVEGVRTSVDRA